MSSPARRWGPLRSLLVLAPILLVIPWLSLKIHTSLPIPLADLTNPVSGLPQVSEKQILGYAKYLSEDIGYRTVGTREHALADHWMVEKAESIKAECDRITRAHGRKLECEVWRQEGSGSHRFDMMNKRLYKTYVNLTNIIVRVSDGTPEGKENAVLINAHLDSTLPSPGAADDAMCVGVMLECIRVLVNTPDWSPKHAIVFLFNHAEESLQDGSHLFSTQHPIAPTVRAVVNLEAAGTTGRELLFQATSQQMIDAYAHVPRPFGTIFANDIFSSGVLLSDTDFRQFEQYLNITGLDIAVVGNSYLYHMRKDLVKYIQPGVAQNMGENTLALLRYLSSSDSPLPSLTAGYTPPSTVFFSYFGYFISYSFQSAKILYGLLLAASIGLAKLTYIEPASTSKQRRRIWAENAKGTLFVFAGIASAFVVPNVVATTMVRMDKAMSWFSRAYGPLLLYGPAALFGALSSQLLLGPLREHTLFTSLLLLQASTAFLVQMWGIGSAAMFFIAALSLFLTLSLNHFISSRGQVSLWTYAFGLVSPLLWSTIFFITVADVFVPLTGRIGADAPADHIVACIVSFALCHSYPFVLPFSHRFGARVLRRAVAISAAVTILMMAIFSTWQPFDEMHQKRLFVLHLENVTTHAHSLELATADGAPGFEQLVQDITRDFGIPGSSPVQVVMDDYNNDWDALYPFSAFLGPYKIELPVDPTYTSPLLAREAFSVTAVKDVVDAVAGTRSLKLNVYHPGIIWTVIAFDAHVLRWTLDDSPPDEFVRHHIKEGSFYGTDTWTVDMVIKLPASGDGTLLVNYIGIQETAMWPGKKAEKAAGGRAMELFEKLDEWLERKTAPVIVTVTVIMSTLKPLSLDEEVRLYTNNAEREKYNLRATLFGIIVALDYLERAYVRDSITAAEYSPACTRLLSQYKTMLKLVGDDVPSIESFMTRYRMDHLAALHRLKVGVPATVEHSSEAGPETGKMIAETTQSFITFMDALRLRMRAKDQLHPILQELVTNYARFKGSKDWEGRSKMVGWLITLNGMKVSEEITEEQSRQLLFDIENAYAEFFRSLGGGKDDGA